MIFEYSILPAIILWLGVGIYYHYKEGSWKFRKFKFSIGHYYLMMLPLVVGLIINSWRIQSTKPLIIFSVFALAGVIGETLADLWWQRFYAKGLWIYNVETVYHRFTSWLNFLPWAIGGLLYLNVANRIVGGQEFSGLLPIFSGILGPIILMQLLLFYLFKPNKNFKFREATLFNLAIIFLPIIFSIYIVAQIFGPIIYELALWFAIVGTLAEYLFGKACQFFISKKLWQYTYYSIDNGHFTWLSIPLFCVAGFYFWIIGVTISHYLTRFYGQ